ncbi:hypothetical protein E2562_036241 [Oryza meyeriana var. granulata]|uniref:DUF7356 domain-containing protein n=1 Tax=Oryza meyeriana var. granulata TaxID=110450 RepID=A0A6G1ET63_9ORYZ|nr:hypothetical protein E2562_036241 [Oryza meyeriana var. granulata]
MGSCRFAALVVLLLALALIPGPAVARALQGKKASPSEGAPAPTFAAGGSHKELGKSSNGQNPVTKQAHQQTQPPEKPPKDSKPALPGVSESKGPEGDAAKDSAHLVPSTDVHKTSPPPEGPGPTGGTVQEGGGSGGKKPAEEIKKVVKCDDAMEKCSVPGEFTACLQVSQDGKGSIGPFVIVQNDGQNDIKVDVEATPNSIVIDSKMLPLQLAKGISGQVNITYSNPNGGEITVKSGKGQCSLHTKQTVSDWQQQFQQFAAYATRMNPIYGASFLVFTVVLVGVVCACCKFARRRASGVPYQQLEMGAQAPNSSGVENTTSTVDGWDDGWDDDWDDEEAPSKPSDKKPSGSISANGLSLRPQTNSKDGWDVDWDD